MTLLPDPRPAPDVEQIASDPWFAPGYRVLVIESNEISRRGLREMLRALGERGLVADVRAASSVGAGLAAFDAEPADLIVVTADLPGVHDEAFADALNRALVLVLLRSGSPGSLSAALRESVNGFLFEQELSLETLAGALQQLRRGEMPMPVELARQLLTSPAAWSVERRVPLLTPRELQVLALLADGYSNKEIARELSISAHGAKRHVANLLMKLNCSNRTTAVARALNEGLLRGAPR